MFDEANALELLKNYYAEIKAYSQGLQWVYRKEEIVAGCAILDVDDHMRIALIRVALTSFPDLDVRGITHLQSAHEELLKQLIVRRALPYTTEDIQAILQAMSKVMYGRFFFPAQTLLSSLTRPLAKPETLAACRSDLEQLRALVAAKSWWYKGFSQRKFLKLLDEILAGQQKHSAIIHPDEWGTRITALLEEMEPDLRDRWLALLDHCSTAKGSTPGNTWLARVPPLIEELGKETFSHLATAWIDAFGKHRGESLDEENANLLRGLIWCCTDCKKTSLASALAGAAIEGYRKVHGGARSVKVANTCVYALKTMPFQYGAAQLERVRLYVRKPVYQAGLEQALDEAARRASMSRADLEELSVPTFALELGPLRFPVGPVEAEVQIVGFSAKIQWYDAAGNAQKETPAAVKRAYRNERKELKSLRDDINRMLGAQRERLEHLPLTERQWPLSIWLERYLNHPVVGCVARRLIWRFTDGEKVMSASWLDGQLLDADDRPLELSADTTVSTWHPIQCDAEQVLKWRTWLERHQITQPFKQAHREVYLLTDAERETAVYSNRFAAHVLRQYQLNALATTRGWRSLLRFRDLDDNPATLELPHWNLRAEFAVRVPDYDYHHVVTDQVSFYHLGAASASNNRHTHRARVPLTEIPPLVFSEVLRDVDTFVGVTSVGNDPTWQDGGPDGNYRTYWQAYSFGDLSATAQTRKQLLERLIPQLTIANRCTIEGRFLKVRGNLRIYKIHLGSGNILMEPNDQYLCIVPSSSGRNSSPADKLYLPFEGDTTLSIILSKAFLLARDTKITDPTITRQIGKGETGAMPLEVS